MTDKAAVLRIERWKLDDLRPHPVNESIRSHPAPGSPKWDVLKASLADCYFDPMIVNVRPPLNGVLVSGHLRRKILQAEGFTHADCSIVELSEAEHLARMIAANQASGEDIFAGLADVLTELDTGALDMHLTGLTEDQREQIAAWTPKPEDYSDLDAENAALDGQQDAPIIVVVPKKHEAQVREWLANGEGSSGPELGKGVLKRCGLL